MVPELCMLVHEPASSDFGNASEGRGDEQLGSTPLATWEERDLARTGWKTEFKKTKSF